MSGPIIRKYGFPNHEQIFGRRPVEHGAEEPKPDEAKPAEAEAPAKEGGKPAPKPDQRGAD